MRRSRILVVEDEDPIRKFITSVLRSAGYEVLAAPDGSQGLSIAEAEPIDLVVLDLMMSGVDGMQVCQVLREEQDVAIVVVSAKDAETDKVEALNAGADDYLTKPFGVPELLARVQAVLRRSHRKAPGLEGRRLARGRFKLNPEARQLTVDSREVRLTRTEFDLLYYLVDHSGKAVPHTTLLSEVWGPEYRTQTEYLHVYVRRLRQKIEADPTNPRHLVTLAGLGYTFRPEA